MTLSGTIEVRLPDGSLRTVARGASALDLAQSIGSRLAKAAVSAVVNGEACDLSVALPEGATVQVVTAETEAGRQVLRHSTPHVLAQAV